MDILHVFHWTTKLTVNRGRSTIDYCFEHTRDEKFRVATMATRFKKSDLKYYRSALLSLRARLRGNVTQLTSEALRDQDTADQGNLSTLPVHMADLGTDAFEQEFTLTLLQNEEGAVKLIDTALSRIDSGTFGTCDDCTSSIPKMRLKAIPYTPHCVTCARKNEQAV